MTTTNMGKHSTVIQQNTHYSTQFGLTVGARVCRNVKDTRSSDETSRFPKKTNNT